MKKNKVTTVLATICLFCFLAINNAWADCDPSDSDCNGLNNASGIVNTDFVNSFGDAANGGWQNIVGGMCGNSQGDSGASFDGHLDGTAEGDFSNNGESANSRAELIFNGHGSNGENGFSNIIADGEAREGSFMSNNGQDDWYANAGQTAVATFSAEDSTEDRELNFTANVFAQGSSGYKFTSEENRRALNIDASNEATSSYSGAGEASSNAMNQISSGAKFGPTTAELYGNSTISCPVGGNAWTNANGMIDITQTPTASGGFKIRASVSVSENSGR